MIPRDPAHPRPQLQRHSWRLLDGTWDFALDSECSWSHPAEVAFASAIAVPFAPETAASGIGFGGFLRRCWYRRVVAVDPAEVNGRRVLVHFGAVDREATIWAGGVRVGQHVGGFTPFEVDITDALAAGAGTVELTVRADDLPTTLDIPRGKQAWAAEPAAIWYPRTTGIWQSVWLEYRPATFIESLDWTSDVDELSLTLQAVVRGEPAAGDTLGVRLHLGSETVADETLTVSEVTDGRSVLTRTFPCAASFSGRPETLLWSPAQPTLIEAELRYACTGGETEDEVRSYTAIQIVDVSDGRLRLNGEPLALKFALDQGFWEHSGMTPPATESLRCDVELVKALGLNGVRKHQKAEDPRWLAQCDELGVLVWEELPSAHAFSSAGLAALVAEWADVIRRDRNHPCIVAWVPVNESWGFPDLPASAAQQAGLRALADLTGALDPSRPVSTNDGWETLGGDIVGIHDYSQDPADLHARYSSQAAVDTLFGALGPLGRAITLDGSPRGSRAVVLSEFGGSTIAADDSEIYGYGNLETVGEWLDRIAALCSEALTSPVLSGYCWTQLTDTYQEANGLVFMDRSPKAPLEQLRAALNGERVRK